MVDFQPIQQSSRTSDYKPDLPPAMLQDQEPTGDQKEFELKHKDESTQESEARTKIFESMMQITLQQVQHSANQAMQRQKEADQNG